MSLSPLHTDDLHLGSLFGTGELSVETGPGRPLVVHTPEAGDPAAWAGANAAALRTVVDQHGAVLVRGLGLGNAGQVTDVFRALAGTLMTETEGFASRWAYAPGVYSSSKWPPNQPMCMHHELSYATEFPSTMLFACLSAPDSGGATGLADAAAVLDVLPADVVDRFERDGWWLTRTYSDEIGVPFADAFGTADRSAVEAYCRGADIAAEWLPDGGLRTRQHREAVLRHPVTGQRCWFNQIAFLNEWTMAPEVREYLVAVYGPQGLPFNTSHGDGEPIPADLVALLNATYQEHTQREPWRAGDLMLVDNIRTAHSREPFEGGREVLVGLADPVRRSTLTAGNHQG